jgi:hypothetical protein
MVEPFTFKEDVAEALPPTPYPMGERRVDDVRDGSHLMSALHLPRLEALPAYRYYGVYDSGDALDTRSIIMNTPLDQSHCHARNDRLHPDPLGCGHCVGYGMKHLLLCYPVVNKGAAYSGSDIYHRAQAIDEWAGTNYQGTSVRAGLKALVALGYVGAYVWTSSADVVAQWLLSGRGPVVVGTSWFFRMFDPTSNGGYLVPTGSNVGGHCWVIDGVNQQTRVFRMLNSWGRYWGVNGRANIRWSDLQKLLSERPNAAASATEWLKA